MFLLLFGIYFDNAAIIIVSALAFTAFYSMASVSRLTLALSVINHKNKVFGAGVFYCAFKIPSGILKAILVAEFGGLQIFLGVVDLLSDSRRIL